MMTLAGAQDCGS